MTAARHNWAPKGGHRSDVVGCRISTPDPVTSAGLIPRKRPPRSRWSHWSPLIRGVRTARSRRTPQPIAGPSEAAAEAGGSYDGEHPYRSGDKLRYAEAEQVHRTSNGDEHARQARQGRRPGHSNAEQCVTDDEGDCRHSAGNDDGGILDRGIERGRRLPGQDWRHKPEVSGDRDEICAEHRNEKAY